MVISLQASSWYSMGAVTMLAGWPGFLVCGGGGGAGGFTSLYGLSLKPRMYAMDTLR